MAITIKRKSSGGATPRVPAESTDGTTMPVPPEMSEMPVPSVAVSAKGGGSHTFSVVVTLLSLICFLILLAIQFSELSFYGS